MNRRSHTYRAAAAALVLLASARLEAQKPAKTPRALPAGVAPFEVATITAGAWYGRFGPTNCAWIDLGEGVLVVDTGATLDDAANLKKQIAETTKGKPVKWIVLTNVRGASNNGLKAFLPTDATIYCNAAAAPDVALAFQARDPKAKSPVVVGVGNHATVIVAGRRLELGTPPGSAGAFADLYLFDPTTGVAYVGNIVTPGACPLVYATDDPKGLLASLDAIKALHPALLVGAERDASKLVENDISATATYLKRVLDLVSELKKKGVPEARVASELQLRKLGDYCPIQRDSGNVVPIFKRASADGSIAAPAQAAPPAKK